MKCIYIDPPYNTGSDGFVYSDNFSFTVEELSAKLSIDESQAQHILDLTKRGSASHSAWLMFMYPRLLLARDLLTDDGAIFISIDDNEQANLKLICDDVFGEENCFDVLDDAGLILFQHLRLKLTFAVPRDRYLHVPEAGPQCFAAVAIPAVVRILVLVIVSAVTEFFIQLCIQAVFHELRDGLLEKILDVLHTADVAFL